MTEHLRAAPGPSDHVPLPRSTGADLLGERIARALRTRDTLDPDDASVAASLDARLAARRGTSQGLTGGRLGTGRGARIAAAGVLTSALAVAGAGAAAAANPYSQVARTVEGVAQAVGINWSAMPDGYTREQYDALWGAGYTGEQIAALEDLWGTGTTDTKARAGQMLLDGLAPPVPAGTGDTADDAALDHLWGAGYTIDDAIALGELWGVDTFEAKVRAGQALGAGETLPLPPTGDAAPGPVTSEG